MPRSLTTLITFLLFVSFAFAQPKSRPSLVPWHEKYNIERVVLSADGHFMATLGDDRQVIISDLRKRIPVTTISSVEPDFLVADPDQSELYTLKSDRDYLYLEKRKFEDGSIRATVKIPKEIPAQSLYLPVYGNIPVIHIDFQSGAIALDYSGKDNSATKQLVIYSANGELIKTIPGLPADAVSAIHKTGSHYWALTANGLYEEKNGRMEKVLTPGSGDRFANMQAKGDTLVILSKYLQWFDTKTMTSHLKTDVASFLAHGEDDLRNASVIRIGHPFIVDENGAAWLANTRRQDLSRGKSAKPYYVAKVDGGKLSYPLKGPLSDMGGTHREVAPAFAYNVRTGVFAFLNSRNDSEAELVLKDKGYLFSLTRRHIPVKELYFLSDTAQVMVRLESYFEDGVIVDLSNGKMEPVDMREDYHVNTERFIGSKDFKPVPAGKKLFSSSVNKFVDRGTWRKGADLRINIPRKDSCKIKLKNDVLVQLNEQDILVWTQQQRKSGQLSFVDHENNPISENWFMDRFRYDSASGLLTLYWKPKTTYSSEIIHIIDLESKKLIQQFRESGLLVLPGGKEYVTGKGIFLVKENALVTNLPDQIQYATQFISDAAGRYITCILPRYDAEDEIVTWDRQVGKLYTLGTHQQIRSIQQDPFSYKIFTIGLDEKIRVWDARKEGLISEILFNANRGENRTTADLQPSYLFLLPDGNYMGEHKYYQMINWREQSKEFTVQQMDARFHRPDRVLTALGYADSAMIGSLKRMTEKRTARFAVAGLNEDATIIRSETTPFHAGTEMANISIRRSGSSAAPANAMVYVNGTALWAKTGKPFPKDNEMKISIPLVDANNHIRVCLVNADGKETAGDYVYMNAQPQEKKDLYFVGLGLSNYKDPQNNLRYATKDMQDIYSYLMTTMSFENVYSFTAKNERVNSQVLDSITRFLSKAKAGDQVICYYAGHGMLDTASGNYYLSTYNWLTEKPELTGINIDALNSTVAASQARKKIMLIDACNSGLPDEGYHSYTGDTIVAVKARGFKKNKGQQKDAVEFAFNHFNHGNGVDIMAAAAGNEYAYETDSLKNGLFTYSLLTALKSGDADTDNQNGITVSELQRYVGSLVKSLSRGRQQPTFRQANLYQDVAVVASDDSYFAAMLLAAKQDHVQTLRICIEKENVPVDKADPSGFTAFHFACREGSLNAVKYLVNKNADIRLKTSFHFSGLYLAAINRHEAVVYYLLEQGIDPKQELLAWQMDSVKKRATPFILYMINDRKKMKAEEQMHYEWMGFLAVGNIASVDSLYQASKPDVNYWHNGEGLNPLLVAVIRKQVGSMEWLINHGANVNFTHTSIAGFTPLMAAAYVGYVPAVELLLKHGADKEAKDRNGKKAIDIAIQSNNTEVITLLK